MLKKPEEFAAREFGWTKFWYFKKSRGFEKTWVSNENEKKMELLKKMFYHFEVRTDGRQDELVGVQGVAVLAPQHEVGVQAWKRTNDLVLRRRKKSGTLKRLWVLMLSFWLPLAEWSNKCPWNQRTWVRIPAEIIFIRQSKGGKD